MIDGDGNIERTGGAAFVHATQIGFPAELTSDWDASTGYAWKRLTLSGVSLTDPSLQVTGKSAVTPDGNESLETGTRGWMEPDPGRRGWIFVAGGDGSGGGGGGGAGSGCGWVAALAKTDCLIVTVTGATGRCADDPE